MGLIPSKIYVYDANWELLARFRTILPGRGKAHLIDAEYRTGHFTPWLEKRTGNMLFEDTVHLVHGDGRFALKDIQVLKARPHAGPLSELVIEYSYYRLLTEPENPVLTAARIIEKVLE